MLNIGTSLTIETDIDWEVLKQSIYRAYERCESMRVRFAEDKQGTCYQYIADREEREIEFRDFTGHDDGGGGGRDDRVDGDSVQETGLPDEPHRDDPDAGRFQRPVSAGGSHDVDAQSLIVFLKDIIEIYCNAKYEGVPYPKDMSSYIEQLQKDLAYEAGSRAPAMTGVFPTADRGSEPIFNGISGTGRLEAAKRHSRIRNSERRTMLSDTVDSDLDMFHLEAEPTKRLMDFCEKYHVSLVCLLLMGLRTYFQKMNGHDDVSIHTTIARRATLKEKKIRRHQDSLLPVPDDHVGRYEVYRRRV